MGQDDNHSELDYCSVLHLTFKGGPGPAGHRVITTPSAGSHVVPPQ